MQQEEAKKTLFALTFKQHDSVQLSQNLCESYFQIVVKLSIQISDAEFRSNNYINFIQTELSNFITIIYFNGQGLILNGL